MKDSYPRLGFFFFEFFRDPRSVLKLRSLFLKLSSILSIPCLRINEAKSPDLVSVSQYYSGELVAFVRNVMEVVPKSMFAILKEIIAMQTNQLKELPTKVDKDAIVKEYAEETVSALDLNSCSPSSPLALPNWICDSN